MADNSGQATLRLLPRTFPPEMYEPPGFVEYFRRMRLSIEEFAFDFSKYPVDYGFIWRMFTSVQLSDLQAVLLFAVLFTILRWAVTRFVSLPLAAFLRIRAAHLSKWPESVWKFIVYSALWGYTLHVSILSGKYDFFQNPVDIVRDVIFDENYLDRVVPTDMWIIYTAQLGFYCHSIFATLYMDIWRKDSIMMMFHHGLTIFLLEFSLLMKYCKVGALVLLLHDICDVLLEFTKLNMYLKDRNNRHSLLHEWLANCGFVLFAISWAWLRLFLFPTKVLYATHWGVYVYHKDKDPKLFLFLNSMLHTLQILHIYWFYFVVLLLVRVATGRHKVEDTREYEETERQHED